MNIGDIKKGNEIGLTDWHKYIWHACIECGKERWQLLRNGQPQTSLCASCAAKHAAKKRNQVGENHPRWKGGRQVTKLGYVEVKLFPNDAYFSMAGKDGYIYEHRLVAAQKMGKTLATTDIVHHLNGIKHDNRPGNLAVIIKSKHSSHTLLELAQQRIRELEQLHLPFS